MIFGINNRNFFRLLFVMLICAVTRTNGQDTESIALDYYSKAEDAYNSKDYDNAVKYLDLAKSSLGKGNSKIYYLKIKALHNLSKDYRNGIAIKNLSVAIDSFFKTTEKGSYPEPKYMEIVSIKNDLNEYYSKELIAYQSTLNETNENNITENYLTKWPNGPHYDLAILKRDSIINAKKNAENERLKQIVLKEAAEQKKISELIDTVKYYQDKDFNTALVNYKKLVATHSSFDSVIYQTGINLGVQYVQKFYDKDIPVYEKKKHYRSDPRADEKIEIWTNAQTNIWNQANIIFLYLQSTFPNIADAYFWEAYNHLHLWAYTADDATPGFFEKHKLAKRTTIYDKKFHVKAEFGPSIVVGYGCKVPHEKYKKFLETNVKLNSKLVSQTQRDLNYLFESNTTEYAYLNNLCK